MPPLPLPRYWFRVRVRYERQGRACCMVRDIQAQTEQEAASVALRRARRLRHSSNHQPAVVRPLPKTAKPNPQP